jgi:uncharacterized membrane protein YphA (DoxX/SURF4 family)
MVNHTAEIPWILTSSPVPVPSFHLTGDLTMTATAKAPSKPVVNENRTGRLMLSATGANLIRILIASYFLALGAGVIPGSDISALFAAVLPAPYAGLLAGGIVFALAYMVLIGFWLRPAALLLALVVFWSSYISVSHLGFADQLGGFWRDMALIAALILTYAETDPRARSRRSAFRSVRTPRRLIGHEEMVMPRRVFSAQTPKAPVIPFRPAPKDAASGVSNAPAKDAVSPARLTAPRALSTPDIAVNVFRDDFDIARVS